MIYCGICEGNKTVCEVIYRSTFGSEFIECVFTGKMKTCPGCLGTGISEKARNENKKLSNR